MDPAGTRNVASACLWADKSSRDVSCLFNRDSLFRSAVTAVHPKESCKPRKYVCGNPGLHLRVEPLAGLEARHHVAGL